MTLTAEKRLKSTAIFMALGGLFVAAAGFCYLRFTPKTFQAGAKIRVWQTGRFDTNDAHATFNAALLARTECQAMRSDAVLSNAIQRLGTPWNQPAGRDRLRLVTEAGPLPDSGVIQLTVTGGDPVQLAAIANEITRAYLDYRQTGRQETTHASLDSLNAELAALDPKILQAWSNLNRACENFATTTKGPVLYDPASFQLLESNRVKMELDVFQKDRQFTQFKSMDRENLRQTLRVVDGRTNVLLAAGLAELNRARTDLAAAKTQHGPDSPEVESSMQVLAGLETNVDREVAGVLTAQAMQLDSLKTSLDIMDQKLKNATTNKAEVIAAHPELAAPARELQKLERQRDALQQKIKLEDSARASLPVTISAKLLESADPPVKPVSPDARIANAVLLTGGVLAAAGLFLRFLLPKPGKPGLKPV